MMRMGRRLEFPLWLAVLVACGFRSRAFAPRSRATTRREPHSSPRSSITPRQRQATTERLLDLRGNVASSSTRFNAALVDNRVNSGAERSPEPEQGSTAHAAASDIEIVPTTMRQAIATFFLGEYNGPRSVVLILAGLTAAWVQSSTSLAAECAVLSAAVVYWWIQEHWMHKYLLHSPLDWYGKRVHQIHHDRNYFHVSIDPAPLMLGWLTTVHCVLVWLLPSWPLALSATVGYCVAGLFYEWSHYIVHTKVRFPKGSFWQRMKDHHIRHHRVDSRFWLAFSVVQVDNLFGTNPDVKDLRQTKRLQSATRGAQQ